MEPDLDSKIQNQKSMFTQNNMVLNSTCYAGGLFFLKIAFFQYICNITRNKWCINLNPAGFFPVVCKEQ